MNGTLRINTQYFENYNVSLEGVNTYGDKKPHWKPKGGQIFDITVDTDVMLYASDDVVRQSIAAMLEKQNSDYCKYDYIDHEFIIVEPVELDPKSFETLLVENIQRQHSSVEAVIDMY